MAIAIVIAAASNLRVWAAGDSAEVVSRYRQICGVVALRQCLHLEGIDISLDDLISRMKPTEDGVEVGKLCDVARELGAVATPRKFDQSCFDAIELPAVLVVSTRHAVSVVDRQGAKIRVIDATRNGDVWVEKSQLPYDSIQMAISIRKPDSMRSFLSFVVVVFISVMFGLMMSLWVLSSSRCLK